MKNQEGKLLKLRIFGSKQCDDCKKLMLAIKHHNIEHDFIDVDISANEKLCDFFDIDRLPVIQALDKSGKNAVISSHVGLIDPMRFIEGVSRKIQSQFAEQQTSTKTSKSNKDNQKRKCNGCYDR